MVLRTARTCALALVAAACQFETGGFGTSLDAGVGNDTAEAVTTTADDTTSAGDGPIGDATGTSTTVATATTMSDADGTSTADLDDTTAETTATQPLCDRALFVTADLDVEGNVDAPLYQRLIELGFTVTVVHKAESSPEDVAGNCLVIVSDIGASGDVNTKFLDATVGVILLEPGLYDDMRLVASGSDLWWGDGHHEIDIIDPGHPLAAGFDGTVAIYEEGGRGSWGIPVASAQVVAVWPDQPGLATLMGYETGAEMAQGFIAPARRVGFPGGVAYVPMTPARIALFEAAVRWAAGDI
jgi:hypothetical protein